ncbi:unnamed protein product [Prorocentrum cordatum]|uniref:Uncharacterized protein n=1 Tax=Prorocentrum cordatum TaxID=2364126 RepID=A0ABN9WF43_9DINO|nr:unnamed protein product [Polarella glacialis]
MAPLRREGRLRVATTAARLHELPRGPPARRDAQCYAAQDGVSYAAGAALELCFLSHGWAAAPATHMPHRQSPAGPARAGEAPDRGRLGADGGLRTFKPPPRSVLGAVLRIQGFIRGRAARRWLGSSAVVDRRSWPRDGAAPDPEVVARGDRAGEGGRTRPARELPARLLPVAQDAWGAAGAARRRPPALRPPPPAARVSEPSPYDIPLARAVRPQGLAQDGPSGEASWRGTFDLLLVEAVLMKRRAAPTSASAAPQAEGCRREDVVAEAREVSVHEGLSGPSAEAGGAPAAGEEKEGAEEDDGGAEEGRVQGAQDEDDGGDEEEGRTQGTAEEEEEASHGAELTLMPSAAAGQWPRALEEEDREEDAPFCLSDLHVPAVAAETSPPVDRGDLSGDLEYTPEQLEERFLESLAVLDSVEAHLDLVDGLKAQRTKAAGRREALTAAAHCEQEAALQQQAAQEAYFLQAIRQLEAEHSECMRELEIGIAAAQEQVDAAHRAAEQRRESDELLRRERLRGQRDALEAERRHAERERKLLTAEAAAQELAERERLSALLQGLEEERRRQDAERGRQDLRRAELQRVAEERLQVRALRQAERFEAAEEQLERERREAAAEIAAQATAAGERLASEQAQLVGELLERLEREASERQAASAGELEEIRRELDRLRLEREQRAASPEGRRRPAAPVVVEAGSAIGDAIDVCGAGARGGSSDLAGRRSAVPATAAGGTQSESDYGDDFEEDFEEDFEDESSSSEDDAGREGSRSRPGSGPSSVSSGASSGSVADEIDVISERGRGSLPGSSSASEISEGASGLSSQRTLRASGAPSASIEDEAGDASGTRGARSASAPPESVALETSGAPSASIEDEIGDASGTRGASSASAPPGSVEEEQEEEEEEAREASSASSAESVPARREASTVDDSSEIADELAASRSGTISGSVEDDVEEPSGVSSSRSSRDLPGSISDGDVPEAVDVDAIPIPAAGVSESDESVASGPTAEEAPEVSADEALSAPSSASAGAAPGEVPQVSADEAPSAPASAVPSVASSGTASVDVPQDSSGELSSLEGAGAPARSRASDSSVADEVEPAAVGGSLSELRSSTARSGSPSHAAVEESYSQQFADATVGSASEVPSESAGAGEVDESYSEQFTDATANDEAESALLGRSRGSVGLIASIAEEEEGSAPDSGGDSSAGDLAEASAAGDAGASYSQQFAATSADEDAESLSVGRSRGSAQLITSIVEEGVDEESSTSSSAVDPGVRSASGEAAADAAEDTGGYSDESFASPQGSLSEEEPEGEVPASAGRAKPGSHSAAGGLEEEESESASSSGIVRLRAEVAGQRRLAARLRRGHERRELLAEQARLALEIEALRASEPSGQGEPPPGGSARGGSGGAAGPSPRGAVPSTQAAGPRHAADIGLGGPVPAGERPSAHAAAGSQRRPSDAADASMGSSVSGSSRGRPSRALAEAIRMERQVSRGAMEEFEL